MLLFTQLLLVTLFISSSLEIRGFRRRQYENDCTLAPNVLAPDLPENCHDFNDEKVEGPLEVLTAEKLNQHPAAIVNLSISGGLSGIEQDCFSSHKTSLKSIAIVGNNIPTFPGYTFSYLSLNKLDLRNNDIVYLGLHPFDDSKIEDLNLNYNKISTLLKSAFSAEISCIRIAKNRVSFIEPQCFPGSLEMLDLRHNLLYDIESDHFSNLENLKKLYLANNHLQNVDFTGNKMKKLELLDLSFNDLTSINQTSFSELTKLEILNLTSNNIKWISSGTLQVFDKLKVLDISLNRFSNFPYNELHNSVEAINSFGNPWNCECFFRMERHLAKNQISSFKCELNSKDLPFCVVYEDKCVDVPNESLITVFKGHMSPDLIQYCSLSGPIKHLADDLLLPEPLDSAV
ncbi:leucine-rich repeat-containing protein let-4-like [Anoplophora glabripennis]|uniref:leucine-rich repeat-containing protein let-4-like n=1 Tax=Anoplophora glabripennis TaxID=217634 RepID=UPI000874EAB8|nr:leucine-rich repeat-containing protein let-4-like [Anoplophora glabripennis]